MTHYLISFPASAMQVPASELPAVGEAARAVIREAKAAGIYRFGGGLNVDAPPVRVAGDGTLAAGAYPETERLDGGFCILTLPSREAAVAWAARIAAACRCPQELREFMFDPES